MKSKFYTIQVFLSIIVTIIFCLTEISQYREAIAANHSSKKLKGELTSKLEASALRAKPEAIIEIVPCESCPNCISRHPLFLPLATIRNYFVSDYKTIDINHLSLIRKDNLFLSILRI